jgi:uncharacterized protein involved in exopolysaccharide biosynthesis
MQFLEYYQIVRERVWLALLTMALGAGIVIAIQLLPEGTFEATGSLYVSPNAQQEAQQSGNDVGIGGLGEEFWATLGDIISSRYVIEQAARETGIVGPDVLSRLTPLSSDRPKRSRILLVTGTGSSADQAKQLADHGMDVVVKYWNDRRLARLRLIKADMLKGQDDARAKVDAYTRELARYETTGPRAGKPTDTILWAQQEINSIDGQLAAAKTEEGMAQDRITSLSVRAREEAMLPPSERSFMTPQGPVGSLESQLMTLQSEKAALLARRTPEHPDVVRVQKQIVVLEAELATERKKSSGSQGAGYMAPALHEQMLTAELSLRDSQRLAAALQQRQTQLRSLIPVLQQQATRYADVLSHYTDAQNKASLIDNRLQLLSAEERRLKDAQDLTVVDKAQIQTSSKVKAKFLAKFIGATIGGFVVGVIFIFFLHNMDMTFKDELEAEQMIGAKVLTAIPRSDVVLREEASTGSGASPPSPGPDEGKPRE